MALEYFVLPVKVPSGVVRPASAEASSTDKADVAKKQGYQVILARNIFAVVSANGLARPTVPKNLESMDASHFDLLLLGTIDDMEGGNRAVILDKKTSQQHIHRQGEAIGGAVIKGIRRGEVILAVNGKEAILDMREAAKQRPVVAARIGDDNRAASDEGAAARPETSIGEQAPAEETLPQSPPRASTSLPKTGDRIFRPKITRPGNSSVTH